MRVHVDAHLRSAGLALRAVCCCMLGCSVETVPCWHHNFAEFLVSGERHANKSSVQAGAGTDHNIVIVLLSPVCGTAGGADLHCFVWYGSRERSVELFPASFQL